MSIDLLPESQARSASSDRPLTESSRSGQAPLETKRRWPRRLLLLVIFAVVVGSIITLIPKRSSSRENEPTMTHTIARGKLVVSVTEQGTLESSSNIEYKCRVRGASTVTWIVPGGTFVEPGDELFRLDTKVIEETVSLTKTNTHIATATLERTSADVAQAEIGIAAYKEGRFRTQQKRLLSQLTIAKSNWATAKEMLVQSELLFRRGYVTALEVEGNRFSVTQAELELKVKKTEIDVLERFTQKMMMENLQGNLRASKSKLEADKAGLAMEKARRDRALEELVACVVKADRSGLVIYPSAAAWKDSPDVTEGATVRKDQVLLLMPDLTKMQVKVGIHESYIDRMRPGLQAKVTLPDRKLDAEVSTVATVTRPAGWWTGNVVKYDTIIELPSVKGLKPGMTAEVEVILAEHEDVLTIPVAAVVETDKGDFCWVKTTEGPKKRLIQLSDSNEIYVIVEGGLKEGDEVVLNPLAFVDEAKNEVLKAPEGSNPQREELHESISRKQPPVSTESKNVN